MMKNWILVLALVFSLAITGTAMAQTDKAATASDENKVENVSPASPQPAPAAPAPMVRGGHQGRFHDQQWSGGPMAKFMKDEAVKKLQDDLSLQEKAFQELLVQETIDEAKAKELTQKISDLKAQLETRRLEHILAFKKTNPDWQPPMSDRHPMMMMGMGDRGFHDGHGKGMPEGKGCMMMGMGQGHRSNHGPEGRHGQMKVY